MSLFLDCEFNGFGGELISMAIVSDKGEQFYEVLPTNKMEVNEWVLNHVIPILGKEPIFKDEFQGRLHLFLKDHEKDTIYADSPADFKYLLSFMEWMTPDNKYKYASLELNMQLLYPSIREEKTYPLVPHNALSDAIGLKTWFQLKRLSDQMNPWKFVPSKG